MLPHTFPRVVRSFALSVTTLLAVPAVAQNQIVMLENFTNGVTFSATQLTDRTWTRTKADNGSSAAADTYNGNPVMKVYEDIGSANGVYAIYPNAVPAAGEYTIRCTAKFVEFPIGTAKTYNAYTNYQIMVTVNGAHRTVSGPLATPEYLSEFIRDKYLTSGDDTANPPVTLQTSVFSAPESASLCISLSTYEDFSRSAYSASNWNGSYILIDNIELVPHPEPVETPVAISGWELE